MVLTRPPLMFMIHDLNCVVAPPETNNTEYPLGTLSSSLTSSMLSPHICSMADDRCDMDHIGKPVPPKSNVARRSFSSTSTGSNAGPAVKFALCTIVRPAFPYVLCAWCYKHFYCQMPARVSY